ncbi:MAG: A/G-specific adenine glycosylase [Treponema sp.]|nr:A/G-specific adenine glycosylase [Treponema sp.]
MTLTQAQIDDFRSVILENYRLHGRDFPWRNTRDAYKILVSEMMLQQTQTLRVLPKYEEWLKVFPDARTLADAPLSLVFALWSGLGYNRRAKYLQEACKAVCTEYGGAFPTCREELQKLPGIGPYTAGAVSTFAFNNAEVFIETNIRSVFIFFFFSDTTEKIDDAKIMPLAAQTLEQENPRVWYYALMDYGAELKKRVKNPSRKSAHYTRQSKFSGSLRQARGAIMRQLAKNGSATLLQIAQAERIDLYRLETAACALMSELFVCEKNGVYTVREQ